MNSNSTKLCRLCLETNSKLINIFESFLESTIASVLAKHFWFQINKDDGMPEWVCEVCWMQTKTFHNFYTTIELRHKNHFNSITFVKVDDIKEEQLGGTTEEPSEADGSAQLVKCKEESDTTLEVDDLPTIADEDSCNDSDNDYILDKSETEQTTDDDEDEPFRDKTRKRKAKAPKKREPKMPKKRESTRKREPAKKREPKMPRKQSDVDGDVPYVFYSRSDLLKQDAEISKFFRMRCEICTDDVKLDTLKIARKHYRKVHKVKGYLICCGNKFTSRWLILDHIQYHLNPAAFRCDQCGKCYVSRNHLKTHIQIHEKPHNCSLCSRSFASEPKLKTHIEIRHSPDAIGKFPCDQCPKVFRTKGLLYSHVRYIHGPSLGEHVCEGCGKTFKQKSQLESHKKTHHSTTPPPAKVQCDICGTWLKHERGLRTHLKWHQEVQDAQDGNTKPLNCPICEKEVKNKRLLANHIRYCHGERKHQCTYCDKAFMTATSLKEHTALHTGVDLYNCVYCDRTFKSNANKYSHQKKVHLAEWTRDRAEASRRSQQAESNETVTSSASVE